MSTEKPVSLGKALFMYGAALVLSVGAAGLLAVMLQGLGV